mgnify:CR=1 FL=1
MPEPSPDELLDVTMQHAQVLAAKPISSLVESKRVVVEPRAILAAAGFEVVETDELGLCCGAAGTYNLTQPEMATRLAARKLDNIATTGAPTCATGNVGCAMHIGSEASARGQAVRVIHPVELLHEAVFGPS